MNTGLRYTIIRSATATIHPPPQPPHAATPCTLIRHLESPAKKLWTLHPRQTRILVRLESSTLTHRTDPHQPDVLDGQLLAADQPMGPPGPGRGDAVPAGDHPADGPCA